jgi:lysyl-tRNA synthetase class 2
MPSAVIQSFQYDPDAASLRIKFQSGQVYRYENVPAEVVDRLRNATSKGQFFQEHIRGCFAFHRDRSGFM